MFIERDVTPENGNHDRYCDMCDIPAVKELMVDDGRIIAMCRHHFNNLKDKLLNDL